MFSSVNRLVFGRSTVSLTRSLPKISTPSSSIITRSLSTSSILSNVQPITQTVPETPIKLNRREKTKLNEKTVLWKLYATFNRHNTRCTLVAVVEDLDFMEKNKDLSYNDKVLYYLHLPHKVKYSITAGQLGFRKSQRQEYEAGFQVAAKMFKTIQERNYIGPHDKVELVLKNFGKGREAFQAALLGKEGSRIKNNIVRITDVTIVKFGGNRPKKLRRL
ncbi:MRPS18 37S ribosomal protein S18 [Candida maltosa Xu316]|uniref:Small ribosomal subunit protein uS11m n=1 Tax=Candida maltosa (strain Xu316) TaxID=1245528 RepID=M3IUI5_CANMX|nr:ribosome protein S18 [Candida maltosa Xu316]